MHLWVKGIEDYSNKGSHPFQRGDNYENSENRLTIFFLKSSSPEPLDQFQPNLAQSILG